MLGPGFPRHRVLQGTVSSCRVECAAVPAGRAHGEGAQTSPRTTDQLSSPYKNLASQLLQLGVLLLLHPLPALHHKTDYPRAEGHTSEGGTGQLGGLLAAPSLAPCPVQAEAVTLASGPPSLRGHTEPQTAEPHARPSVHRPTKAAGPGVPGRPGRPPLRLRRAELGAGARGAPTPYLGQQPEGEEERGVHGATAECPPAARAEPPAPAEPG